MLDDCGFLKLFFLDVFIVVVSDFSGSKSLLKIGSIKKIQLCCLTEANLGVGLKLETFIKALNIILISKVTQRKE